MIIQLSTATRDLLAHCLPKKIARFILPKVNYVFLAHLLDLKQATIKYPFARFFPEKVIDFWAMHYWPITIAPIIGLNSEDNKPLRGYVIIIPLTAEQMFRNVKSAQDKILKGVRLAEKMQASLIGLGGFTSILTHDGKDLLGKANIGITTGNSLSSLIAILNLRKACKEIGLDLKTAKLAIVGSAGSVASACAKIMVKEVKQLLLIDTNKTENKKLYEQLAAMKLNITIDIDTNLEKLNQYDCIIIATSSFVPIIKSEHLKKGTIVVDACHPKNVDLKVLKNRRDILVIDSGVAEAESIYCHLPIGLIKNNEVYSCLAETLILARKNYKDNFSIGKVNPHQVEELYGYMKNSRIKLAEFRNADGYIQQNYIHSFKTMNKQQIINKN